MIHGNGVGGGGGINMDGVQDSIVRNNLLYDNHASGIIAYQIDGAEGPRGLQVLHNTVDQASNGRWALQFSETTGRERRAQQRPLQPPPHARRPQLRHARGRRQREQRLQRPGQGLAGRRRDHLQPCAMAGDGARAALGGPGAAREPVRERERRRLPPAVGLAGGGPRPDAAERDRRHRGQPEAAGRVVRRGRLRADGRGAVDDDRRRHGGGRERGDRAGQLHGPLVVGRVTERDGQLRDRERHRDGAGATTRRPRAR